MAALARKTFWRRWSQMILIKRVHQYFEEVVRAQDVKSEADEHD